MLGCDNKQQGHPSHEWEIRPFPMPTPSCGSFRYYYTASQHLISEGHLTFLHPTNVLLWLSSITHSLGDFCVPPLAVSDGNTEILLLCKWIPQFFFLLSTQFALQQHGYSIVLTFAKTKINQFWIMSFRSYVDMGWQKNTLWRYMSIPVMWDKPFIYDKNLLKLKGSIWYTTDSDI